MLPITIRTEREDDQAGIAEVHRAAFGRDEEATLVEQLRDSGDVVVSFVAVEGEKIVGHLQFCRIVVHTPTGPVPALALAPVAVLPSHQRQRVGTQLIQEGLIAVTNLGHKLVTVLGHPEFYCRFGFSSEAAQPLEVPFAGPEWMAMELVPGSLAGVCGRVEYPAAFGIK